jgi:penicillin amidase
MKWVWRILFTLIAVAAMGLAGLFIAGRMTLPMIDGEAALEGPKAEIRIVRDRFAVPHITATSRHDGLFALGYVHAQDRMWQMEFQRRIGQGRLSEFAGDVTLKTDIFLRTMGFYKAAEATLAKLDQRTRDDLQAYADGVNAWLVGRDSLLPPEFHILGVTPEPWRPADTVVWLKMMAMNLSGNWTSEALRARIAARLGADLMRQLWPEYPADAPIALEDQASLWQTPGIDKLMDVWPAGPTGLGSNNWVIDGGLSATGKPMLANDPHLGLQAPSVWYFAHVDDGDDATIGATLPGVPFIVLGRNRHIAWGFTNTAPDVQDLIIEEFNPDDPDQYLTESGWESVITREEVIRISGAADHRLTVRSTRHGPILFDATTSTQGDGYLGKGQAVAIRWHVLDDDEFSIRAGLGTAAARTVDEFIEVMRDFHGAQQNMVVADVSGNIGFVAAGRVPIRADQSEWQGMLPGKGWDPLSRRTGFIPFDELPQVVNPATGYVITANNRITGPAYPHFITNEWAQPFRAQRIRDLLTARTAHTIDSFREMQGDQVSLMVREFLPLMLQFEPADQELKQVIADLRMWDGNSSADRTEPTIFSAWYREFARQVLVDQAGPEFQRLWAPRPGFFRNVLNRRNGAEAWCDDTATDTVEDCAAILERSLSLAIAELEQRYGTDRDDWVWGPIHTALSDHNPLTNVPFVRDFFDLKVPVGGDSFTINVAHGRMRDAKSPFQTHSAASLRAIYDLDDLDRSIYVHSTGQSGNPMSPHYADMTERWRRVDYVPMSMRKEDIEPGAIGTLILLPE